MSDNKLVLGIETSCDDTSLCILEAAPQTLQVPPKILSFKSFSQEELLAHWGGIVPEIAARNHLEKITPLLKLVLKESGKSLNDIDLIGVTTIPGLLGPLLTGVNIAKTISLMSKTPITPINHLYAHLEAIHLTNPQEYPYLGILVSGGHSLFMKVESPYKYQVLGSTIDDAAGEAFDKGGRIMGLPYPSGKIIDDLAQGITPGKYQFSIGLRNSKNTQLSFSGVKTQIRNFIEQNPEFKEKILAKNYDDDVRNMISSYQEAIVDALILKSEFALPSLPKNCPIVLGGGVACNSRLRSKLKTKYGERIKLVHPKFCTDNGAMIANLALRQWDNQVPYPDCLNLDARGRFISKTLPKDKNKSKQVRND